MSNHPSIARRLSSEVVARASGSLPASVIHEAKRTLFNALGTMIGASDLPAVRKIVEYAGVHGGTGRLAVPGRLELLDTYHAAMAMGVAGHLDDFDDTHLETVIHPGAACAAAALAASADRAPSGQRFLNAVALGCEVQLRVGAAMSPAHYDAGWHITGTCGVIGAAVSAGVIARLDESAMTDAMTLAASVPVGVREAFGTMSKALHVGKAAANGLVAAELAEQGLRGVEDVFEAPAGYFALLSNELDPARLTDHWGTVWELAKNTYKPYPCGIVIHPVIDAAIALHADVADHVSQIREVVVRCHPLVVDLTGNPTPTNGLEARFSAIHGAAIGLSRGRAGLREYADDVVTSEELVSLRDRVRLVVDDDIARDSARVEVDLAGDRRVSVVDHARGSLARPLTQDELMAKVRDLVEPRRRDGGKALQEAVEHLEECDGLLELHAALGPDQEACS